MTRAKEHTVPARKNVPSLHNKASDVGLLLALLKLGSIIGMPMKDEVADPNGLSTNDLRVLMCLGGEGALSGREIATIMSMTPMNVSRALTRLEELKWTEPVSRTGDRRRRSVQLSADGWRAYGAMLPDVRRVARRLFETLNRAERGALAQVFERLIDRIEGWNEETTEARSSD
jgi:DNA-binding MarR family transcriptional regulator